MGVLHALIATTLSPEAKRVLIDTPEDEPAALAPGPLAEVVRRELEQHALINPLGMLTTRGEVVRDYVLEEMLP
jgi:hypothetical protein